MAHFMGQNEALTPYAELVADKDLTILGEVPTVSSPEAPNDNLDSETISVLPWIVCAASREIQARRIPSLGLCWLQIPPRMHPTPPLSSQTDAS